MASVTSVTDRVRPLDIGAPVAAAYFFGDTAVFVGAEEAVTFASPDGALKKTEVAFGGILCSTSDGKRIVLGTDDGKVVAVDAKGEKQTLATDAKRRWIDNVALHADGGIAW